MANVPADNSSGQPMTRRCWRLRCVAENSHRSSEGTMAPELEVASRPLVRKETEEPLAGSALRRVS